SSAVTGCGVGWHRVFVNRHVSEDYDCIDHHQEMVDYLKRNGFYPNHTVAMMTAVELTNVSYRYYEEDGFSVLIVVTASIGNATDASVVTTDRSGFLLVTINLWVFNKVKLQD